MDESDDRCEYILVSLLSDGQCHEIASFRNKSDCAATVQSFDGSRLMMPVTCVAGIERARQPNGEV